jgi:hypothetical protein
MNAFNIRKWEDQKARKTKYFLSTPSIYISIYKLLIGSDIWKGDHMHGSLSFSDLTHTLCLGQTDRKLGRKLGLQSHQTTLATEIDLPEKHHYYTRACFIKCRVSVPTNFCNLIWRFGHNSTPPPPPVLLH